MSRPPTAISLFSGAGGEVLGLEAAGFDHLALCELNPAACATLRAAGLGPVVEGDVRDLDAIGAVAGPTCDLLWSSFPCQPFSSAGAQRSEDDDRNGWPWTVDALDRFRPTWMIGENVRGLTFHRKGCAARNGQRVLVPSSPAEKPCRGCYFEQVVMGDLRERFAFVGWWILDAADYGVPQHRRRVILWAGPAPVVEPVPTHGPGRALPWVSMGEALGLSDFLVDPDRGAGMSERHGERPFTTDKDPAPTIRARSRGASPLTLVGSGMKGSEWGIGRPAPTLRDGNGTAARYLRQPSPAVTTTEVKGTRASRASGGEFNGGPDRASDALWAATGRRRLTVEECSTLQGIPAAHPWQGNSQDRYRQVGNAVPPALAQAIGEALRAAMIAHGDAAENDAAV